MRHTRKHLPRALWATLILASAAACAKHTRCEYAQAVVPLDGRNELVLSTFPSFFPQIRRHVPFVYKELESPHSVNFQFFVRAVGTTAGQNPNIDSIRVRRLTYAFPGQEPVTLMQDFTDGFWQQGTPQYGSDSVPPVQCFAGWYVTARFDMVVNGQPFTGEQRLDARERSRVYPLLLDALR